MSIQPTDAANKASSNNLNRQAALYSLAAAAAGVSLLAMVQPAAGEVVITRKTIPIPLAPRTMQDPVKISIANNGIDNFSFILSSSDATDPGPRELEVGGVSPGQNGAHNQIIAGGSFYRKALALPRGAKIGPSANFSSSPGLVEGTNSGGSTGGEVGFHVDIGAGVPKTAMSASAS